MSNFLCVTCGTPQIDSPNGYVSGCCHHPPHNDRKVVLRFDDTGERDAIGYYDDSFYLSKLAQSENRAVHPVRWHEIKKVDDAR